jgi:hypothetical protein
VAPLANRGIDQIAGLRSALRQLLEHANRCSSALDAITGTPMRYQNPCRSHSNSTVSLDPDEAEWYYQHLPGDDWDADYTHERTLVRTNQSRPAICEVDQSGHARNQERDVTVAVGEGVCLDRRGKFSLSQSFPSMPRIRRLDIDVRGRRGSTGIWCSSNRVIIM